MRLAKAVMLGACLCITAPAVNAQQAAQELGSAPRIAFAPVLSSGPPAPQQQERKPESSEDQIGAVVILGNEAIGDARYQEVVEGFFGEPRTEEVLARLTNEIAQLAKDAGYAYARTRVEDDENGFGVVQVVVDEGRVDEVRIEGYENAHARRILTSLAGRPALQSELERALLLVSDIPSVRLKDAKLRREDGRGILLVTLEKRDPLYRITADNYGTQSFGPVRALGTVRLTDVLGSSDRLNVSARINPLELDELLYVSGAYQAQLGTSGLTFGVNGSIGNTSPGGAFGETDLEGESVRAGVFLTQPVMRSKKGSVWVEAEGTYINISQDELGSMLRDDTVVTASLGLRTQWAVAGGQVRAGVSHVRGLGILGATRRGDPLASRNDASGKFSKVEFWANGRLPIAKRLDILVAAGGQISDRPLLSSEEMALGGAYRTRGYNFSEVLGDEGVYGLAELRYRVATSKLPLDFLQLYAFVDGGYVSDIGAGVGEGSLFSAGPGVRARIGPLDFEVEGGFPLGGSAERGDDNDPQVNVRAGISF